MGRVKVRRTHREELPGIALLRESMGLGTPHGSTRNQVLDLDMEIDPNLAHLAAHDNNGFFSAVDHEETLGYGVAHVRSRQWVLSEMAVLPEHRGRGAGSLLLSRLLAYGERSGVRSHLAVVPPDPAATALLLGHGFRPLMPLYRFTLSAETAAELGDALARLLPGHDQSQELLERRGQADLDRIDKVVRGLTREVDHVFWLKRLGLDVSFIRQGARIAAYGYGGRAQVGPVAGTTQEATLAALGQAMRSALAAAPGRPLAVRVPAAFEPAIEALLDGGAVLEDGAAEIYVKGEAPPLDRYVAGLPCLP
ncbi:MAG TPA: GNAT family N-acetyltransferase [Acidobacteria bacterium]|nr:GNAT family N-acetyltransferase [Acidobacteriota bacterium]